MLKELVKEFFFLNLGGKVNSVWPGYEPGKPLRIVKEKKERKEMMYVVGPCNTRVYFDTITARRLLRLEAGGIFYNCYFVEQRENGILYVLMCRAGGMFHPEDILL